MLNGFPVSILAGILLGFLAGLGIGGGSLLLMWLTLVLGEDPMTARGINLLFFIPTAVISSLFRTKAGSLKIKPLLPAIAAACISAWVFTKLSFIIDPEPLKKAFGLLLILTGIRELFYRRLKAR